MQGIWFEKTEERWNYEVGRLKEEGRIRVEGRILFTFHRRKVAREKVARLSAAVPLVGIGFRQDGGTGDR